MAFENLREEIEQEFAEFIVSPHQNLVEGKRKFNKRGDKFRTKHHHGDGEYAPVSDVPSEREKRQAALWLEVRRAVRARHATHCVCGKRINGSPDEPLPEGTPLKFCSPECRKKIYYKNRKTGCAAPGCPGEVTDHGLCSVHVSSPPTKVCPTCRDEGRPAEKSVLEFYRHPLSSSRYSHECKVCSRRRQVRNHAQQKLNAVEVNQ